MGPWFSDGDWMGSGNMVVGECCKYQCSSLFYTQKVKGKEGV